MICTVPTPFVQRARARTFPRRPARAYDAIRNIGVVCVVLKLKRSVTPHFWVNVVDPRIEIPGIIEFSNLRPTGDTVVYVPYYMPADASEVRPVGRRASSEPRASAICSASIRR